MQVCQKLKDRNTELVQAAPKAAAVQAQHELELRKLLTQAQEDIEKHRKLAAAAQRDKKAAMEQVIHHNLLHRRATATSHASHHCCAAHATDKCATEVPFVASYRHHASLPLQFMTSMLSLV
jgi:hypothetical protein